MAIASSSASSARRARPIKEQARCAVKRVAADSRSPEEVGVYDKTFVVISSDHGIGLAPPQFVNDRQTPWATVARIAGNAMALLVVKPLNSQRSRSHVAGADGDHRHTGDDPRRCRRCARNCPGEPALKLAEDAPRVRPSAFYDWEHEDWAQNYFEHAGHRRDQGSACSTATTGRCSTRSTSRRRTTASRTRGLYELHRSRSGLEYRWSMPHVFFHAPAGHAVVRDEDPIRRAEAADRHGVGRRSGARHGDARRPVVGHDQSSLPPPRIPPATGCTSTSIRRGAPRGDPRGCSACRPATSFSALNLAILPHVKSG